MTPGFNASNGLLIVDYLKSKGKKLERDFIGFTNKSHHQHGLISGYIAGIVSNKDTPIIKADLNENQLLAGTKTNKFLVGDKAKAEVWQELIKYAIEKS